jgi:hypothetical protein
MKGINRKGCQIHSCVEKERRITTALEMLNIEKNQPE